MVVDGSFVGGHPGISVDARGGSRHFVLGSDGALRLDDPNLLRVGGAESDPAVLMVYVPVSGQSAEGAGWINDPGAVGRATFGFAVRYKWGSTPTGQSEYAFRGGDGFEYVVRSTSWSGGAPAFVGQPEQVRDQHLHLDRRAVPPGRYDALAAAPRWRHGGGPHALNSLTHPPGVCVRSPRRQPGAEAVP